MPSKYRRNVVVGDKTWEKLRTLAKQEERSMSDILREAILKLFIERKKIRHQEEYNPVADNYKRKND